MNRAPDPVEAMLFRYRKVQLDGLAVASSSFDSGILGNPAGRLTGHIVIGHFMDSMEQVFCRFGDE